MNPRDIWILYLHELRSALRERAIVVNSILMPIFLYPVLLWVMFSAMVFIQGLNEGFTSRVALAGDPPPAHRQLVDSLEESDEIELRRDLPEDEAVRLIGKGELDAYFAFAPPPAEGSGLADNFRVEIGYDESEARSRTAAERVEEEVDRYRSEWMRRQAAELGLNDSKRYLFAVADENVASEEDLGALLLGMMIPLFLAIMVALGCFFPAVDTTAGERERSTWETLMTTSASRQSVVIAKYLYVATMGVTAGTLNVIAIFVSIGAIMAPLLGSDETVSFQLPLAAIPVMILGAAALALMLAAGMMILASFARTFKDGQAMVQPVYFAAIILPLLLGQQTGRTLDAGIAAIPVANVAMMIRDAINGVFLWPYILETVVVSLAVVALCLGTARFILKFEDFLMGSYDGSFWRFARERLRPARSGKDAA